MSQIENAEADRPNIRSKCQIDAGCGSDTCGESGFWKGHIMYLRGIYSCKWLKQSQCQREIQQSGCKITQRIVALTGGKGHGETFSTIVSGRLSPEQRSLAWYETRNSMESYRACASLSITGIASIYARRFFFNGQPFSDTFKVSRRPICEDLELT
jgi:hypothetical protein